MHCPQCGQQQVSEVTRFCSRCGFPMEGVAHLLQSGGLMPVYPNSGEPLERSQKFKGVRQGVILFLAGVLLVPIMGVFSSFTHGLLSNAFEMLAALLALICFVGGPLRVLFAALFEQGAPKPAFQGATNYGRPIGPPQHVPMNVLPPANPNPVGGWRRPNTAELADRPSVTENTTRLLNKDPDREYEQ